MTVCLLSQGAGTDDDTLIRVMVTRSEVDLFDVRTEFRKLFACSLFSMIKVQTHTHCCTHLVNMLLFTYESFIYFFYISVCSLKGRYRRRLPKGPAIALWWR